MPYITLWSYHISINGIIACSHDSNRILKLLQMSIRKKLLIKYNSHSETIFKKFNLLKVTDIYVLNELKFYHKYINNLFPITATKP